MDSSGDCPQDGNAHPIALCFLTDSTLCLHRRKRPTVVADQALLQLLTLSLSISRKPLIACVEKQLLGEHLTAILQKGRFSNSCCYDVTVLDLLRK